MSGGDGWDVDFNHVTDAEILRREGRVMGRTVYADGSPVPDREPEPTLREQIAKGLREAYHTASGSGLAWPYVAAKVEAFARAAHKEGCLCTGLPDGLPGFEEDENRCLRAALPALSSPPPERPAQTETR